MADSNVTKRALATAMKQLMAAEPFSKISVGDICQVCQMNRKSFYYHFRDKYDLVNWIFQTEFLTAVQRRPYESTWALIGDLCEYFYENRAFYHNALSVEGQNSFQDYFREILAPVMRAYAEDLFEGEGEDADFFINFFSDALIAAMLRWLSNRSKKGSKKFWEDRSTSRVKQSANSFWPTMPDQGEAFLASFCPLSPSAQARSNIPGLPSTGSFSTSGRAMGFR